MPNQLSPEEKKRLTNFLRSTRVLARWAAREILPKGYNFIMRQQMRQVLIILGARHPDKIMIANALEIMRGPYPLRQRRLRKLINGRRSRQ
jgi:transposase